MANFNQPSTPNSILTKDRTNQWHWLWVLFALIFAVLIHLGAYQWLNKYEWRDSYSANESWHEVRDFAIEQVYVEPEKSTELLPPIAQPSPDFSDTAIPEDIEDIIPELKGMDVDLNPNVIAPAFDIDTNVPALGESVEALLASTDIGATAIELADNLGSTDHLIPLEAQPGQVVINAGDTGLDTLDPDEFTQTLINQQKALGTDIGTLDGFSSLDNLLRLPRTELNNTKALIGSDLLFPFNSSDLHDTAKTSLYKVAILIDKNPEMYCWLEGHTDSIGSKTSNRKLSEERAQAVKNLITIYCPT